MKDLWRSDAVEMASAIRARRVSSREFIEATLARIQDVNPTINAIVECRADEALRAADEADAAVRRGDELAPLHGVPITTKVNVDQAGYATTDGVAALKDNLASSDSPVVSKLRKAGAVFVGRTNTPAFSSRWFTDNDIHGRTLNPINPDLTPGGSSGGASAAVATGMCALAHGNDIGGSIRYPAYACGVAGLRPSFGRVPAHNSTAKGERPLMYQLAAAQGPLARTVRDLRLGLAVMSGPDPRDPWSVPAPLVGAPPRQPIRVAMSIDPMGTGVAPIVEESLRESARYLAAGGYLVEEVDLPMMRDATQLWNETVLAIGQLRIKKVGPEIGGAAFLNAFRGMSDLAPSVNLESFIGSLERRMTILREWTMFFERYPVALLPVSLEPPFKLGRDQQGPEEMAKLIHALAPMLATPVLGVPGVSVPIGFKGGIPMGVQIVAAQYRDDLCFDAAEVIETQARVQMPFSRIT